MEDQPFSDTGMIVFGAGMGVSLLLLLVVPLVAFMLGGRHRMLTGCGGCMGSLLVGVVLVVACTIIARMV